MKETEKKEKPTPKRCVCGSEAAFVKTRSGKMFTCPDPVKCKANLSTAWNKHEELAIIEWNGLVDSYYAKVRKGGNNHEDHVG